MISRRRDCAPDAAVARTAPHCPGYNVSPVSARELGKHMTTSPEELAQYIEWLEERSMLKQAEQLSELISGSHVQWQNRYSRPRPRDFVDMASVWFASYPKSLIPVPGKSVVETLGDETLLETFRRIGIEGIHTGPMKRAGGITGREYTPSIDGFFDRIELVIDPLFGTDDHYSSMIQAAANHDIAVIGDLVPAHTGKGPDFRLAERGYKRYPGLYTMIEIPEELWDVLGPVPESADSVNLPHETLRLLEDQGYIPGALEAVQFYDPGVKDTSWSATEAVVGADGITRRWVYLHVFKAGQPSLNWLDPSYAAQRVVMADVVQALHVFGTKGLRLDANALMAVEGRPGLDKAWVEGHPVSEGASDQIAMMIRKLGGFSFQELALGLDGLKAFTTWGPDLSYDFVTRPPYLYAVATGDAGPLRMMMKVILESGFDSGSLVHALQNHDELMFGLNHLNDHPDDIFVVNGEQMRGREIYDSMYVKARDAVSSGIPGRIREFTNLGFCATLPTFIADALKMPDPSNMSSSEKAAVQRLHLLAAAFNAMQPGVFAISGWDLMGNLTVPEESLGSWIDDGDGRWINRGAFDLMGANPHADGSGIGLPRATALYGPLPDQLRDPTTFVSEVQRMLEARRSHGIAVAQLSEVPDIDAEGVLAFVLTHEGQERRTVVVLNFGREAETGLFSSQQIAGQTVESIYSTTGQPTIPDRVGTNGEFRFELQPMAGEVFALS
jgi:trehalose synthase